ncbi:acetyl-CoA synthetase [Haloferax mediterranei ATCC 33500]|uniref:acetate--CoA ligase n=1 Tax=Haloferax mediterranei (strain ATCC 33500 / DSM 1411 / JCM 8866 / NBRC 14739 / NCIMB 2177 / R-4) TaxID=523841 RepID=I3R539_HALMT|nr:AMP-binding protein [Haloferax mediterranei]AFK19349.1 acyl-CoA synthetase [Haloferax mediterranei ATCC 33500]EMA04460.1 acyl-CoA synthetase [Haloferax mediterranei ATCC 33500]MDX5989454.1 AMP-binding protein [Haloferax mediterranei ATCC 33500]QCQ75817.1 acetyl-CoA synthetase [Haloferax mediterranei ATCC 33500]
MDVPDTDTVVHEPDSAFVEDANVTRFMREHDIEDYDELIERTTTEVPGVSASGVDWFWDELVDYLDIEFYDDYDEVRDNSDGPQFTRWYPGGELNIAHNVLDRHAAVDSPNRNRVACIWEGEDGEVVQRTFHDLYQEANRVANVLESYGVGTGDTVGLYMPMVPEVISILYGCFKVGATAVPIFSGFGVDATATRLEDPECSVLFTADGFYRRGSEVRLKPTADEAIEEAGCVEHVVVYQRFEDSNEDVPWTDGRDELWANTVDEADSEYETKHLPSDAESMLLYSSGTTGKPKGIVHTHAGVQAQTAKEIHFGFDQKPEDRFFWVSDIGWMMGPWTLIGNHTFAGTIFMYEGAPDHPEPDRFWDMIERHRITTFGISPTAIRALRKYGDEAVDKHDLSSLRLLGSTGEPWDPESWMWFYEHVGGGEAPIINISGGTEICGCFLMPMPTQPLKPCSLGGPGLGMDIDIVDSAGESIADTHERGFLVARDSCPAMTKSLWSGDERYLDTYWSSWENLWDHGDWAQKDEDGFWFLHGRADDALNVAGRKVGPAEVEGALIEHDAVNQAAAVGADDDTTGTAVVAYVVLEDDVEENDDLREKLRGVVGEELGKPFRPREILFVDEFPKTQSGKIIRRAIASIYAGEELGDMSSIENPEALEKLEQAS